MVRTSLRRLYLYFHFQVNYFEFLLLQKKVFFYIIRPQMHLKSKPIRTVVPLWKYSMRPFHLLGLFTMNGGAAPKCFTNNKFFSFPKLTCIMRHIYWILTGNKIAKLESLYLVSGQIIIKILLKIHFHK